MVLKQLATVPYDVLQLTKVRTQGINLVVLVRRNWFPVITSLETKVTRLALGGFWVRTR